MIWGHASFPTPVLAGLSVLSWGMLIAGAGVCAAAAGIAAVRGIALHRSSRVLAGAGMLLAALACGEIQWERPDPRQVLVMVDLSPSTRGAAYRNPEWLVRRIDRLLGRAPRRVVCFGQGPVLEWSGGRPLETMPAERTEFSPPPAGAVLLFSDGQFELPVGAPPTYIVVDPLLESPEDVSVRWMELRGSEAAVGVASTAAEARELSLGGTGRMAVPPGGAVLSAPIAPGAARMDAVAVGKDLWPENDAMSMDVPRPAGGERWWVGARPPAGFLAMELPEDSAAYLSPAVIVLDNQPAADFSQRQLERLEQYARDLGGGLVMLGGDRAFAAGMYAGTALERLSPLASVPPKPTLHWVLLADASGSMAGSDGGPTRFEQVTRAMVRLLPRLPAEDAVTVGSFAETVRWWTRGRSARETMGLSLPPADVRPHGPTNLEPALLEVIGAVDGSVQTELLLLTDADARLEGVEAIEKGLLAKRVRLHLLALRSDGRALRPLERLVGATGGRLVRQDSPEGWTAAIQNLYAQVSPRHLIRASMSLRYEGNLASLGSRTIDLANRVWLKRDALKLATGGEDLPLAASWRVGSGIVLAAAFSPSAGDALEMARLAAQPPADPRLRVSWESGRQLRVRVEAADQAGYLNGQRLALEMNGAAWAIPQAGPGRYELAVPAPREPALATVRHGGRVLDRRAVAGRYAEEFEAIGNNRRAMAELAGRTGGAVIGPNDPGPIRPVWPGRRVALTPWLAMAGGMLVAAGLVRWKAG